MKNRTLIVFTGLFLFIFLFFVYFRGHIWTAYSHIKGRKTIEQRLEEFGPAVHQRIISHFNNRNISYPPEKLVLVGLKKEKILELWASGTNGDFQLINKYGILAASGKAGPKLKEGDNQVPEGIYKIISLNPNSRFHLSVKLNYPNEFDRERAAEENRDKLGGDIMIHGSNVSIGCLAIGNQAIEELFVLAAETGIENIKVIISPVDFRESDMPQIDELPEWTDSLYEKIKQELMMLQRPEF